MKWRVRKPGARNRRLKWWHRWFAWYPVRVPTKGKLSGMMMIWLEYVERKGKHFYCRSGCCWEWKYRYPTRKVVE